MGGKSSHI